MPTTENILLESVPVEGEKVASVAHIPHAPTVGVKNAPNAETGHKVICVFQEHALW